MTRWNAVANVVVSCHYEGRPVLVGTTSVEDSETLSMVLDEYLWRAPDDTVVKGVAHNLLNARPQYAAREAETIAQAGRLGAVTIATNMAGRGTDILLGGNAEGLARKAMKEHLFEALGLGDVLEEERETAKPCKLETTMQQITRANACIKNACGVEKRLLIERGQQHAF